MKATAKLLLALALTSSAFGASLTLDVNSYSNGGNGGSYSATITSGPATNASYNSLAKLTSTSFETFCLEPTEYFSPGSSFEYTINSYADAGANEASGRNSTPGDQLSKGTTWLYSQFAQGLLSSATYASGTRKSNNELLQRAFWYLEDDYTGYADATTAYNNNVYLKLIADTFLVGASTTANLAATLTAARDDAANGAYGVWALNITTGTVKNQSQLYYNVTSVPETGATAGMLGLALVTFAALRRRFVNAR